MTSLRRLTLYTVDAFTSKPFTGNPAAVCLDDTQQGLGDETMQKIAAEMNISETAFIRTLGREDTFASASRFGLRWFTPTTEVPLCGHATLASAAALFFCQGNKSPSVKFETASGTLETFRKGATSLGLDLPLNTPQTVEQDKYKALVEGVSGRHGVIDTRFSPTTRKLLVRLADSVTRKDLEALRPETASLPGLDPSSTVRGVIVTIKAADTDTGPDGQGYDFLSRYFAPWVGIPEDPVTGSAHTVLAGYWASELSKKTLFARQCSQRGGDLWLYLADNERVNISGNSTVVVQGTIAVPV